VSARGGATLRAALFFALATLVLTWPLALRLDGLFSTRMDQYLGYWNLEWTARWLADPSTPYFHAANLLHPRGAGLAVQPLSPLQGLIAAPVTLTAGPIVAYNLLALVSFWLAGFATYLFVRRHAASEPAAWLAGAVFAFAPHHFTYLPQLNLVQLGVVPLYLVCCARFAEAPGRGRALVAGLALAAVGLCDWYYGLAAGAAGLVLAALRVRAAPVRGRALALEALHFGACLAVLLPVVVPMARGFAGKEFVQVEEREGLAFLMRAFKSTGCTVSLAAYAGCVALVLAAVGASCGRRARAPLVLAGVSFVFALGRSLTIGTFELPLPFALLERLPVLGGARYPDRFFVLTQLGLAWLAALGVERLAQRFPGRPLAAGALALVLLEFAPFGLPGGEAPPATLVPSAATPPAGAVFHVPTRIGNRDGEQMLLQLAHGRAIGGAYLTRREAALEAELAAVPGLGALYGARPGELPLDLRARLEELGFAFVCVRKQPVQRGVELEPARMLLSFRFGGREYLRQRLTPGYQGPREVAAQGAAWIEALTERLGPPVSVTDEEALFALTPR